MVWMIPSFLIAGILLTIGGILFIVFSVAGASMLCAVAGLAMILAAAPFFKHGLAGGKKKKA